MRIDECRICHNKELIHIGSLGDIAISNFTKTPEPGDKYPLELVYCDKCTLLQLAHNFPREKLYQNYWYESHISPVINSDLQEIALYSDQKERHIDIGGNDGTLLSHSTAKYKISVDPSNISPGKDISWYHEYWEDYDYSMNKADLITAIAVLYAIPDPNVFIANVTRHLAPDGIFIAQLMPLQPMIENNDVGNICHEHLEYYSYEALSTLFELNGLEIFKVEKNNINGGSYRVFARHYKKGSIDYKEKEYTVEELKDFFKRIEWIKWELRNFLDMIPGTYGYGASTKANTILQYYGLYRLPIIDIHPDKIGKYPICGEEPIINKIPEDAQYLWAFPYGFIDFFRKKEIEYKGKWVVTMPTFEIL